MYFVLYYLTKKIYKEISQIFIEKKVLTGLRGEEGRYEITPIIRYVVNAEFLQSLLSEYQQLAAKAKLQQSEQEYGESSCKK